MTESISRAPTIICLASYFKGTEFMRECKRQGARVILLSFPELKEKPHIKSRRATKSEVKRASRTRRPAE